ncbi:MAG: phosphopantothenoylcysteine decarboxylase [Deltaproteobacteria bacterium]|nr:phosphopantothenoylcysteine decarboxylase [Deltaproteobacteria bacterium]
MSKRILITSGPTRAPLDAVRFLSNRSTGRFGRLLAQEALRKGMGVTFVYGVGSETPGPHESLRLLPVETDQDLSNSLKKELRCRQYDAVIHAMAVLDFEPSRVRRGKVGSRSGVWTLDLRPTPKIIRKIKQWSPKTFLVGFKLEASGRSKLLKRARCLMKESRADLVVGNFLTEGNDERHVGYLIEPPRRVKKVVGKKRLSRVIISKLIRGIA